MIKKENSMTESSLLNRNLHALLIGVDCYLPNRLPDGNYYPSLGGCVRDINHVESFLTKGLGLPGDQITKLTATDNGTETPPEPEEKWPTYDNMVRAFKSLIENAGEGDQVYIHYSGHGGRTITGFPALKGPNGLDESLVPTDIGRPGTRYLRDVEIAHLLKQMVDKGLVVTVVFDSCHSGGATRGEGTVRGISSIDTTERPAGSLVASHDELVRTWQGIQPEQTRSAQLSSGWLPVMKDTVLLAACRANELANEFAFDGRERNGALTYWLLDSLKQVGPGLTYEILHDRILAKVHAKFPQQTPQLQGTGSRVVFDVNRVPRPPASRVMEVDRSRRWLKIEAGQAQGISAGAHFAIYGAEASDFAEDSARLALVEAKDVQPTESWAEIIEAGNLEVIEEGAQAVLLDRGAMRLRGRIRLVRRDDLPQNIDQDAALQGLEQGIQASKWVRLAADGEGADYQVAVNANGEYEVWEPSGRVISNLRPAVKIIDTNAPARLTQRLVHLTKYNNVKLIDNPASTSALGRLVTVEVVEETAKGPGGEIILDDGEIITFRITNTSSQVLNFTVLDLQPDWGITQLYPPDKDSEILDPKASFDLPVKFEMPGGYRDGVDTMKVFATVESTNFRWLELPRLDNPPQPRATRSGDLQRGSGNPLQELMADFAADTPPENRTRASLAFSVAKWATVQVDVRARRRPRGLKHVRDLKTSLLQAAFEEVAAEQIARKRAAGEISASPLRPGISDPMVSAVNDYLASPSEEPPASDEAKRGAWDTAKYCASLAAGMAGEFWDAFVKGDRAEYDAYKEALTKKFGGCDPNFKNAAIKYAEFLLKSGEVPYRRWHQLSDFVIEGKLPAEATIGLIADWATGQNEALEVLRQVKRQNPQIVIHLGDTYYAGTAHEMENYFYRPWTEILEPNRSGITSFVTPGNHDLYSGGEPFYDVIDRFGQPASYYCLRNEHWQVIGLDTALNDRLGGPATTLEETEVEWLRDKIENAEGRRTVLLSHHQLFSTNEQFDGKSYNEKLHRQLEPLLSRVDIWFWGHEHDLVIFGEYKGLKRGRCIGGSAFPVGKYEMPEVQKNPDVPFNSQVMLSKGAVFYQHCYAVIRLNGPGATVDYYEDGDGGRLLFSESL
jgi:predicted phosphodiesterase